MNCQTGLYAFGRGESDHIISTLGNVPSAIVGGDTCHLHVIYRNGWSNGTLSLKEAHSNRIYSKRDLARTDIFDLIEVFYNQTRRHSHIGGVSPEAFKSAAA